MKMSHEVRHPIPPTWDSRSEVLILGSFPSVKSREAGYFYGHPRNRFWEVLAAVFEEHVPVGTEERRAFLLRNHIAVWDVIASCEISGSSDSSIRNAVPNDLSGILNGAKIRQIFCNGQTAFRLYQRFLRPVTGREAVCLPSTSPANAAWTSEKLAAAWGVLRNSGYSGSDDLTEGSIRKYLGELSDIFEPEVFQIIGSTNTYLKEKAAEAQKSGKPDQLKEWHTVIASGQSAGRGRLGRSFSSPAETGLYLSVLLRPRIAAERAVGITTAAAVAACRSIEACTGGQAQIKWVNDIFMRGKKVCGILTEASVQPNSGRLDWAVMGIGFNVYEPQGGFPEELREIAGPVAEKRQPDLRSRIAAVFLREFRALCRDLESAGFAEEYRERSFLPGRKISVLRGGTVRPATALDIDSECRLIVRYEDGSTEALSSGEVSVRPV